MKRFLLVMTLVLSVAGLYAAGTGDHHKKGGKSCPTMGKKIAESKSVEMTGKLLCKHCNLHETETCEKVFQPSSDEKKLIALCPSTKIDAEKLSEEGTAVLSIKGKLVRCEDGTEMLVIDEATKVVS